MIITVSPSSWGGDLCPGGLCPEVSVEVSSLVSLVSYSLLTPLVSSPLSLVSSPRDMGATTWVGSLDGGLALSTISTTNPASGPPLRAANRAALNALLWQRVLMRRLMKDSLNVDCLDMLKIENRVPYKMMTTINIADLEVHITIGEPTIQVITNWATTKGTS